MLISILTPMLIFVSVYRILAPLIIIVLAPTSTVVPAQTWLSALVAFLRSKVVIVRWVMLVGCSLTAHIIAPVLSNRDSVRAAG